MARPNWQDMLLSFDEFEPHRLDATFDVSNLKRVGLVVIGRAFFAALTAVSAFAYH
jgi:hypothetical protein